MFEKDSKKKTKENLSDRSANCDGYEKLYKAAIFYDCSIYIFIKHAQEENTDKKNMKKKKINKKKKHKVSQKAVMQ